MSFMETVPLETTLEAGGYAKGVAVAIVTQNHDPERLCRVKVRYPWYDQPRESYWARLSVPMAGKDRGVVMIPEVGDEVLVAFEREDLRFPYVLGGLWNGVDTPPETNADGKNDKRIVKSRKGHYLLFNDGTPGVVDLAHVSGKKVIFNDDSVCLQDERGNHFRIDSASGAIDINASGALTIKASTITIEASATMEIKASATMTIKGAMVMIN
jgi:uncharacterized protein involved in type VI secretion and phage assembly